MRVSLVALALLAMAGAAVANDTTAQLGTGGLAFISNFDLKMESEDLYISPDKVRVEYQFRNVSDKDQDVLVAFPLPDIEGSGDFNVAIPNWDEDDMFGFTTTFNGKPVSAELHQYAFAFNLDQSAVLRGLDVPLVPYGERTQAAINALSDADKAELQHLGMVIPMEYDDGSGWKTDYVPVWTLRSTYSWEAHFDAGETAEVVHEYQPSVGGTVAVTFLSPPNEDEDRAADYLRRYCTDAAFLKALKKRLATPDDPYSAPYTESWISYIWSTGSNWAGPIGRFHLTIDKGDAKNLVSFCWDGDVKKTGPTIFEMEAEDWYPPWNRELEILILPHQERSENAG